MLATKRWTLGLLIGAVSLAACQKKAETPVQEPPRTSAVSPNDPTAAPTTGESVPGTGDTRAASKAIDDEWITSKTKAALLAEPDLKSTDIQVETRQGTVMLTGTVPSAAHSEKASAVAHGIEGVTKVDNRLTVR